MRKLFRLSILAFSLSQATACQSLPRQDAPSMREVRCGGVSRAQLQSAYTAALQHVRRKGLNEQQFLAEIENCPKADLRYFRKVLTL